MSSIEKRVSATTKEVSWRAKVRLKGYAPQTNTFKTKTAAQRWAQRTEADIRDNKHFPSNKAKKHTVSDLIDQYLSYLSGKNPRRYKEVKPLLAWWKTELGHALLSEFQSEAVLRGQQKLIGRCKRRKDKDGKVGVISPARVNRYTVALHTAIQFGIKPLKWISVNPVDDIEKLEEPAGRTRYLSPPEIDQLFAACRASKNRHLFLLVLVALATGARRREIQFMKWSDVSPDCTLITLPKTKNKSVRSLSINGLALELLRNRQNDSGGEGFLFPSPNDPARPIDFESAWRSALKEAGIMDFRFHDLRHTHASYLAMEGASTLVIKEALGHKTLAMAERYAHLAPGHVANMVKQMTGKVLGHVKA